MPDTFTLLALDEISLDADNARRTIDEDKLAELTRSIEKVGVIQPVIVRVSEEGSPTPYTMVAGERRYRASTNAGRATIPAIIRASVNGDARTLPLVENLQRVELTPIEEARAFETAIQGGLTPAELATAISRSPEFVKDRLALLQLPETVQEKVRDRTVTLAAAKALGGFAALGEHVVAKAAELVAGEVDRGRWDQPVTIEDLETNRGWVLGEILEELPSEQQPFLVTATKGAKIVLDGRATAYRAISVDWPETIDLGILIGKAGELPENDPVAYKRPRADALEIKPADIDAARAYGCLLELDGEAWFNDPVWLSDRLDDKLDRAIKSWQRTVKSRATKAAKAAGVTVDPDANAAQLQRDARRAENQQAQQLMLSARERNVTLGIALFKGLHAPPVTAEAMRIVAELLAVYAAEDLGRSGLRFVDEESQTVTTRKDGTISRVAHAKGLGAAAALLHARLAKATTPEQILGVLLQAIVAARFADVDATTKNDQHSRLRGLDSWQPSRTLVSLVDKLAKPHLPAEVLEALNARREEEERERREHLTEDIAKVREGRMICPACGHPPATLVRGRRQVKDWTPCQCTDEQVGAAVLACPRCSEPECFASCSGFAEHPEEDGTPQPDGVNDDGTPLADEADLAENAETPA